LQRKYTTSVSEPVEATRIAMNATTDV